MLHTYFAANPRRPVHWRWERARSIAEGGPALSRRFDDEWVNKAYRFRLAYQACETEADHATLAMRAPDLYWAHDIWYNTSSDGGNPFKSEMEARLLAQDTRINTARRLATTEETVHAYERVFFNIEERHYNHGYLLHQVIGPSVQLGLAEQDYDSIWKLFALFGGPHVLDMMIDTFTNPSRPQTGAEVVSFVADCTQNAIRRKAMLAAHTIRVNNYSAIEMIAAFVKLLEVERMSGRGAAGIEAVLDNVDMMLRSLPVQVGGRVRHLDVPALDKYDGGGVELRAEEMVAVGLGQGIPADAVLEYYAFPPPPPRPEGTPALTEG
jgi:hypothetical protein